MPGTLPIDFIIYKDIYNFIEEVFIFLVDRTDFYSYYQICKI